VTAVVGTNVTVRAADGDADGYLARPDDGAPHPGILMYHDLMGIRPVVTQMADRLAAEGYTVLIPNSFYRHGPAPTVPDMPAIVPEERVWEIAGKAQAVSKELTPEDSLRDAQAWLDWLDAEPLVADGPFGLLGYCHGGMVGLRTAGTYPDRFAATAIIHGSHMVTDAPDSPHLVANRIKGEVYLISGDRDVVCPPEEIERLDQLLTAAGVAHHVDLVPGANHGFSVPDFPSMYDQTADEQHWVGMLDLFRRNL
jgi:carboxymethylenebutenolidase